MNEEIFILGSLSGQVTGGKVYKFSGVFYDGGPLQLGGWKYPVVADLATMAKDRNEIPVLYDHKTDLPLGKTTVMRVGTDSITGEGEMFSEFSEAVNRVITVHQKGFLFQVSIGTERILPKDITEVPLGRSVFINGRRIDGPIFVVRYVKLKEVSVTPCGAAESTALEIQASLRGEKMEGELILNDGIQNENATATTEIKASAGDETITITKAEFDSLRQNAELQEIRTSRPALGFLSHESNAPTQNSQVIQASFLASCGFSGDQLIKAGFNERVIEAAESPRWRGETFQTAFRRITGMNEGRFNNSIVRAGLQQLQAEQFGIRASNGSHSSSSATEIFRGGFNRMLDSGFRAIEDVTALLSKPFDVRDFRETKIYSLNLHGDMEAIPEGGEIKHASLSESEKSIKVETRGKMVAITREMIINDDLGAASETLSKLGRKVAIAKQKTWFAELLKNLSEFNSANKNIVAGKPELTLDGLSSAIVSFDNQVDENGDPILISGRYLLVPPSLYAAGLVLQKSATMDGASSITGTTNPVFEQFSTLKSPYIGGTSPLEGGSDRHWFLISDPGDVAIMGVAHLGGNRNPILEQAELDFNRLGMSWRCYFDFGVKFLDWRGGVYSTGQPS